MGEYFVVGRSAPAPQNRCICHRLNFLGTTVSTSYCIETLRAPNRPVERGHTRFLYQGSRRFIFTILLKSLFHEKSTRMYSNISSSFLPPPFFLVHFFFLSNASSFIKPSFHSTRINASSSRRASEEFLDRFSADPLHPAPPLFFLGRCRSTGLTRGLGMRDKPSNVNRGILVRG